MKRIPNRTLLLMVLALAAFARLWCATHRETPQDHAPAPSSGTSGPIEVTPVHPERKP